MINTAFTKLFTYKNIYRAHIKGRQSKRAKKPIVKFEIAQMFHLKDLEKRINKGKYKLSNYNSFIVYEPKQRQIQTLQYGDRIVQHILCDFLLAKYFTRHAVIDNSVCQIGKGTHFALRRFQTQMHKFIQKHGANGYFLKCDIHKYFPSIPHKNLKQIILKHIKDTKLKAFLEMIIDSYHTHPEYLAKHNIKPLGKSLPHLFRKNIFTTERGVPIGNQTSQIFGMFYLDKLDRVIKEQLKVKIYCRYMDDFILVHHDKQFLINALKIITQIVEDLGLKLNSKTQIFPIKNGVTFLGFRYYVTDSGKLIKKVAKKTIDRFRAKAKLLNKAYSLNIIDLERIRSSLSAYHGHLKHGNNHKLEQNLFKLIKVNEIYKTQLKGNKIMTNTQNNNKNEVKEQEKLIKVTKNEQLTPDDKQITITKDEIRVVARKPFILTSIDPAKDKEKEMEVFTASKKLSEYVFVITEKAPKKFRWDIVTRLRNITTDIIANLYSANLEIGERRLNFQKQAGVNLRLLDHYAETAYKLEAISFKQMNNVIKLLFRVRQLLGGWAKATKKLDQKTTPNNT